MYGRNWSFCFLSAPWFITLTFQKRGESPGVVVQWVAACSQWNILCVFFCGENLCGEWPTGERDEVSSFRMATLLEFRIPLYTITPLRIELLFATSIFYLLFCSERCSALCTRKVLATHWWHAVKPTAPPSYRFFCLVGEEDKGLLVLKKQTYTKMFGAIS